MFTNLMIGRLKSVYSSQRRITVSERPELAIVYFARWEMSKRFERRHVIWCNIHAEESSPEIHAESRNDLNMLLNLLTQFRKYHMVREYGNCAPENLLLSKPQATHLPGCQPAPVSHGHSHGASVNVTSRVKHLPLV